MAYREAAGCSANNRMEVSARKLPLIPPTRLRPAYSKGSLVSVTVNNVNPRTGAVFSGGWANIAFTSGCYAQFLPRCRGHDSAMADLVSTLTQRSVEAATTKEAPERVALSGNRAHQMFVFVF